MPFIWLEVIIVTELFGLQLLFHIRLFWKGYLIMVLSLTMEISVYAKKRICVAFYFLSTNVNFDNSWSPIALGVV